MTNLIVATNNAGKVKEIHGLVSQLGFSVLALKDLDTPPTIIEDANSFEGNAIKKAQIICNAYQCPALGDDSGLEVDALGGRPGVLSARYGGEGLTDKDRYVKLLEEMFNVNEDSRTARFRCSLAFAAPDQKPVVFNGTVDGKISFQPAGTNGFGYDPVFIPRGYTNTMAELSPDVKKTISHRAKALQLFFNWINDNFK